MVISVEVQEKGGCGLRRNRGLAGFSLEARDLATVVEEGRDALERKDGCGLLGAGWCVICVPWVYLEEYML